MAEKELIFRVIVDDKEMAAILNRDAKAVEKLGKDAEKAGVSIGRFGKLNESLRGGLSGFNRSSALLFGSGAFIGAASATAAVRTSINAASDLNEQITKTQQVFGDSSKAILDWSKTTARAIGTSQTQALEAASTFGNLFSSIHLGTAQTAEVSRRLVQLAADLASFNNATPEDALQAIRSGLVGEVEPLRRYGVLLSEARVQQEALKESGKTVASQLTDQDKALARIAIIFKDTALAQGDFARTSDGLANQQRILSAQVKDLESNIGRLLLPSIKAGVTGLNDAASAANALIGKLHELGRVKIPVINIPLSLSGEGGGGGPFGFLGDVTKLAPLLQFSPALFYAGVAREIKNRLDGEKPKATTALAAQFKETLGGFFQDALDQAVAGVPAPKVKGTPGFATGLKPEDILGPLIKDIPKKLQEQLLDVQIASPDNAQALINVLEKQKRSVLDALQDPRLTRDDRIELKTKLKGIEDSIAAQNAAIKATAEAAAQKRQDAVDNAKEKQQAAQQKLSDSFKALIAGLQLGVDRAGLTKGLNDDLDKLKALKVGLEKQVKAGVDVVSAQSQLVTVTGQIADKQEEIRQKALEATQARQFRALGLTGTGDEIVPGIKNLATRLSAVLGKVASGDLNISSKLANQLRAARKLINTEGDKLTRDTRAKINEFIKAVNGGDSTEKLQGPLTRNSAFNASKIIEGLGLTPDLERTIRQRVASFNNADIRFPTPRTSSNVNAFGVPIIVENHNTITLDGDVVGRSISRSQQKTARRNPVQKRGPNRNI